MFGLSNGFNPGIVFFGELVLFPFCPRPWDCPVPVATMEAKELRSIFPYIDIVDAMYSTESESGAKSEDPAHPSQTQ